MKMGQNVIIMMPSCIVTLNSGVLFDVKKLLKLEVSWILLNIDVLSDKIDPSDDQMSENYAKSKLFGDYMITMM